MTYENAQGITKLLVAEGAENFCMAASLDAVLRNSNVSLDDYRLCIAMHAIEASMTDEEYEASEEAGATQTYLAKKYFPGLQVVDGLETGYWIVSADADPFNPDEDEGLAIPQKKYKKLRKLMKNLEAEYKGGLHSSEQYFHLRKCYQAGIGTLIVIENAFDQNLTVLGASEDHVFGISREYGNRYFLFNTPTVDGKQEVIRKLGPYTLEDVVGLPTAEPPKDWPEPNEENPYLFDFVNDRGDEFFALHVYPAEPH